jgi:hypothetical protein
MQGQFIGNLCGTKWHRDTFSVSMSILTCQYHSTNSPYSYSCTACDICQRTKGSVLQNLPNSSALPEVGKFWKKGTVVSPFLGPNN